MYELIKKDRLVLALVCINVVDCFHGYACENVLHTDYTNKDINDVSVREAVGRVLQGVCSGEDLFSAHITDIARILRGYEGKRVTINICLDGVHDKHWSLLINSHSNGLLTIDLKGKFQLFRERLPDLQDKQLVSLLETATDYISMKDLEVTVAAELEHIEKCYLTGINE